MPAILEKVLRFGEGRVLKKLNGLAQQVNALESGFTDMTDEELREETDRFKERLAHGEKLDDLLPERSPRCARPHAARWASGTSTCSSWVARPCTWQHRRDEDR